ncbi:hypothetical protein RB195_023737 [Necator americanus]|uniref:Uncharacterized protein n=2 Tax=Necator americanus TaxID=51031 RepID=A0ABR1EKD8_NECAM
MVGQSCVQGRNTSAKMRVIASRDDISPPIKSSKSVPSLMKEFLKLYMNKQVIAAEGEQKASRSLREAASVIASTPAALQLRYLQTLNSVAAEKNSTIIFPLPMELVRHLING